MTQHTDKKKWEELAEKELRGKPLESLDWETPEGIKVKPLYTPEDIDGLPCIDSLPGFSPYVRGPKGTMYSGRP
ncbi:MAG: methylmalonyl-CoA mutase, partial [Deltaproteobacteria bacterium]|nr:methylmalonyl-CoA mutase [Deltaproteobacteria bacterium]